MKKWAILSGLLVASFTRSLAQCEPTEYYDQLISSFHSTISHNTNGTYSVWGQHTKNDGSADHLSPVVITPGSGTDQYDFTGTILKVGVASSSTTFQGFLLTTTNLYTWGGPTNVVDGVTSGVFHSMSLPATVATTDIKILTASTHVLAIVTNSGEVWIRGEHATFTLPMYGDGSGSVTTGWHKVTVNTVGTPDLTGVTQIAIQGRNGIFAYVGSTGKYYTWGNQVTTGSSGGFSTENRAVEMTAPFSGAPKMIEATGTGSAGLSYFALNPVNGKLYCLGGNTSGQLGNNSTTDAFTWTTVKNSAGTADLDTVVFISANQHDYQYGSVAAIVANADLYVWGNNNNSMIGTTANPVLLPTVPNGFTAGTDNCLYVEVGGHTTVYVKDGNKKYCYVGHRISGSMGDGSSTTSTVSTFDCSSTADAKICGATSFDAGDAPNSYEEGHVAFHDIVDFTTSLYLGTTPPSFNNNNFKNVLPAQSNVGSNGEGFEEDALPGAPKYYNTGSFSITPRLTNTTGATKNLYGWVDWNNNGLFDVSELQSATVPNGATSATLTWASVPTTLLRNVKYYLRLRLTSDVLTTPNLFASDGEVEDFYVQVPVYPPLASDIMKSMSNNNGQTEIPALTASEPDGVIRSFKITSLPSASAGTLYFCNPSCVAVAVNDTIPYADRGKLKFDPLASYTGSTSFNYTATDDYGIISEPALYTIVTTNQPPVANNVANRIIPSGVSSPVSPVSGYDADGTVTAYIFSSLPNPVTEGTLTYCTTPPTGCGTTVPALTDLTPAQVTTLTFTPVAGYTGLLDIPYIVRDNNGNNSNTGYLSIPVWSSGSDDLPPVADNIINPVISNNATSTPIAPLNGTDLRGNITTYNITSIPPAASGTLYLCDPACTPITGPVSLTPAQKDKLQFDPEPTFIGTATFNYTVTNDRSTPVTSAPATVTLPVGNTPPTAEHILYSSILRNTATNTMLPSLTGSDADGTVTSFTINTIPSAAEGQLFLCTTPPSTGCVAITAGQSVAVSDASKITFRPGTDYTGTVSFTYSAVDNNSNVGVPARYDIVVNTDPVGVGNPPITSNVPAVVSTGGVVAIPSLVGSDLDADILRYVVSSVPPASEGIVQLCNPICTTLSGGEAIAPSDIGNLTFTPAAGFVGISSISYYAADDDSNKSNISTAKITVVNVPPIAVDITAPKQVNTDGPATLPSLAASDVDGSVSNYVITSLPGVLEGTLRLCVTPPSTGCTPVSAGQVLTPSEAARLTFEPQPSFLGYAKFGYTAIDNNGNIGNPAKMTIAAGPTTALPLQLLSFTAITDQCTATLKWTVAHPEDVLNFAIEMSNDGKAYQKVGTVLPTQKTSYNFPYVMKSGTNYFFRITGTQINQEKFFTSALRLNCGEVIEEEVVVHPNPVTDLLHISNLREGTTVSLYKFDGQLLHKATVTAQMTTIQMNGYPVGAYLLSFSLPDGTQVQKKIVKQ